MHHTIYKGDCLERVKEIVDKSIHLTVTSPPYFNAKEYHQEENNVGNNKDYADYLSKIRVLIKEIFKKTIDGGIVVWNTSPVINEGKRFMIPQDTHNIFIEEGFTCRDDITWKKPDGAAHLRCGGWCQNNGRPMTWHPNKVDEKVMVYEKPGKREQGAYDPIKNYYNPIPKDLITNVWLINPETSTHWHDAPYPEELVQRCILLFSYKGDTIFDPFLGSGTTMKVAKMLGRNSIGIELSDEYLEKAKEKIGTNQTTLFNQDTYEFK
jgi:site-specific DNA-methyltransferase (adenine-specific)